MTKIQKTTLVLIILAIIWEVVVLLWSADVKGAIIRVDLLLSIPVLVILVLISLWQYFNKK